MNGFLDRKTLDARDRYVVTFALVGGIRAAGAKRDRLGNAVRETNAISRLTAIAEFQWSR